MNNLNERLAALSPEQLELLRVRTQKQGIDITKISRSLKGASNLPAVVPDPVAQYEPFPLTDVQQAYWIGRSGSLELGNVATHRYIEFESVGLDLPRLEKAAQRLIERHDMLRAIVRPDGMQQILADVPPYQFEILDLREKDAQTVAAELEAVRTRMSHQVLPSDRWPMFDVSISCLDGRRFRLHVSMDALIADAWSSQLLGRDLMCFYENPQAALPSLEISFRDYVQAELRLHETDLYRRSLEYWHARVPQLPPAPDLPLAKSPGSLTQPHFIRRAGRLEPERWSRLKERAAAAGLTPSGVLLAAYSEAITIWSKSPHFTINLTLFNRLPMHPQVDQIAGDFTSLTLLEVDNSKRGSFTERARRIQEQLWKDLDHSYVGGVHVIRELARRQGGAPRALMPIVFTSTLVQRALGENDHHSLGETTFDLTNTNSIVYAISQTSQAWLDHQIGEQENALVFNWDAVEDLFPDGLLDDMFEVYNRLLLRLTDVDETWQEMTSPLVSIPAAQLQQRTRINTVTAPLSDQFLHTLFMTQLKQRPDQDAVIASQYRLTYAQLHQHACHVAHWLRARGARPNTLVGVVMEKGWEEVVAVLGILYSGAAYLPISAHFPEERIRYLLENGSAQLVLTQPALMGKLEWPTNIECLCVQDAPLDDIVDDFWEPVQRPEDLAYVIYTSGSTGQPKGVMIDHRGAVNTILDINQRFGVCPDDRVLALSALNFDLSVYDIFGLLAAGGAIVIPDVKARRDPAFWAAQIKQEKVSLWNTVPALMEMLVEYMEGCSEQLPDFLRLVMMSGDWIPVTLPNRIRALAKEASLISLGGATEASIWSILYPIEKVETTWSSIPYGKAMVNQSFHVLDETLEPRPVWVPGELYIGGIGLAKGYWRDVEKTQARFITHPRTGEKLYRTGDLGRFLPDGNIEFLGREDFQVKVQGYRIELGEIEAVLLQHPEVQAGVITAIGEPHGNKRLVAYIVLDQNQATEPVDTSALQEKPVLSDDVILDPLARFKFKTNHPGLRDDLDHRPGVQLPRHPIEDSVLETYLTRRSYRKFDAQVLSLEHFSHFLSCLNRVELEGVPLPKYRYGSAGSLYPVQVYVYIKPDRVENLAGGTYYYHPFEHRLIQLSSQTTVDAALYPPGNREIFEQAAFSIYLVGQMDAIEPLYGKWSRDFCLLEAGLITQLLETWAPVQQIGLCQIGAFDFESLRPQFQLGKNHIYLHGLVGGRITLAQTKLPALVEDTSGARIFLNLLGEKPVDVVNSNRNSASFSVPKDSKALEEELRRFMGQHLPEYMVPSAFMVVDALPLTPNGKVDRNALPALTDVELDTPPTYQAPQNEMEKNIAAIWQDVLGVDKIGIHDGFFNVGGNSVHLVRIHTRLREVLNRDLPITEMFRHPTIHALAKYIDQAQTPIPDSVSALEQSDARAEIRQASRQRRRQVRRGNMLTDNEEGEAIE